MANEQRTMPLQQEVAGAGMRRRKEAEAETAAGNIPPRQVYIRIKGQGAIPVIADLKSRTVVPKHRAR